MAFTDILLGSAEFARQVAPVRSPLMARTDKATSAVSRRQPTAQELVARLIGHRARMKMLTGPRISISISVFTPGGRPAVELSV
jgi:hypothetical protein